MYPGKYISKVRSTDSTKFRRRNLIVMLALIIIMIMVMLYSRGMSAIQIRADIALSNAHIICDGKEIAHTNGAYDEKTWRVFIKKGRGACMLRRHGCRPLTFKYDTASGPAIVPVQLECTDYPKE